MDHNTADGYIDKKMLPSEFKKVFISKVQAAQIYVEGKFCIYWGTNLSCNIN